MKFVMFPEGVGFFPEMVPHDEFRVYSRENKLTNPIAAGTVYLKQGELLTIAFEGVSINLGINSTKAFPDWVSRHEMSGLPALQREYPLCDAHVFFFPFAEIGKFEARGIGASSEPKQTSLDELVKFMRTWM